MAIKRICCILTIILSILSAQIKSYTKPEINKIFESVINQNKDEISLNIFGEKSKEVRADAGKDIQAPSNTTILLDASRSTSKKRLESYVWFFKEGIIFQDDYHLNETDSVILYDVNHDTIGRKDDRVSIKMVTTTNKFIELTLPVMAAGTKFPVILKVVDKKGNHDSDVVWVIINDQNKYDEDYTQTDSTGNQQQKHLISKVNIESISIQPINKGLLKTMEVEIINAFLFNETRKLGFQKVIDPNRFIPDSVHVLKLVERIRFDTDTLINIEKKSSRAGIDLSASNITVIDTLMQADTVINSGLMTDNTDFLEDDTISLADTLKGNQKYIKRMVSDTTITIDSMIVYETIDTSITLDTLMYSETVDTVLYYNFNCINDSCAAENALLEGVGQVLTWGINEFSELEVHFFDALNHLNNKPLRVWTSSPVVLNPDISEKLHYPEALAITDDGKLLVAAANDQAVYELNLNQDASTLIRNKVLGEKLLHPSGIDVGPNGIVYVSDRDNHRMFSVLDNYFESLLSPRKNTDGSISKGQAFFPTKITVGPGGDIYVLYEGNDSVVKIDKNYDRSLVLQPSIVNGIRDIAVNSKDNVFVVSPSSNMVYQVINDSTVVAVAGMDETDGMVKNNIKATDSFLGLPVAIDFDSADQLYIGDNKFGLVRRVDNEGIITTLFGINNKVEGIADLRVSKGSSPNIFISQPMEHQIQRISLERVYPWRTEIKIPSPNYIISKSGVYGLEPEIHGAIADVFREKLAIPQEKKTIVEKLMESNRRFSDYIKKRPILFALLLILINQGISASIDGGGIDLPPDFPGL